MKRLRCIWLALFLAAPAGAVAAAEPGKSPAMPAAAPPERLEVRTGHGRAVFLVDRPDARRSTAAREGMRPRVAQQPAPPALELTSTVIIKADDLEALRGPIDAAKATAGPMEGMPGYWVAQAPSVRSAASLAESLHGVKDGRMHDAYVDLAQALPLRDPPPTDPGYVQQWHLDNLLLPQADLNVVPAWAAGYTGTGVTVGVVEDGWTTSHPDIFPNYNATASQTGAGLTSHGTSVAGLVAAVANNGMGGAGVAYGAKVAKLYRGTTATDHVTAFTYRNDLNSVKTNSWGPPDTGIIATVAPVERDALAQAVTTGRNGLGEVFVWAAGNGGIIDRVDYDPYASSRYTIAVGAIDDGDDAAYYNESGSSMFTVAPSSGDASTRGIYTTSGTNTYTPGFGGTSAASPMAAGVVALMLQANPSLTWRDVHHILARSARHNHPTHVDWTTNGAGRHINYSYGFGAIDAGAAVAMAQTWAPVPPEASSVSQVLTVAAAIPDNNPTGLSSTLSVPVDLRVEAVEVVLNATHSAIGDLRVELVSPMGTHSLFAVSRSDPTVNYADYLFTSVRHWDERSPGTWTLHVADEGVAGTGTWNSWQLRLYGTWACRVDWDHNGAIEPADVSAFVNTWFADLTNSTRNSNFDDDPMVTPADVSAFVNAWFAALVSGGC